MSQEPDVLPPQLSPWLNWPVAIVGTSAMAVGLFVGLRSRRPDLLAFTCPLRRREPGKPASRRR